MLKKLLPLVLPLLTALTASSAWASGDFTCEPVWALKHAARDDCSNTAFLSPGNDSRINLQLLMLDLRARAHPPAVGPNLDDSGDAALFTLDEFGATVQAILSGKPVKPADPNAPVSDLADGEGSRCVSNTLGSSGFIDALKDARGLPDSERAALAKARDDFAPTCNGGAQAQLAAFKLSVRSAAGRQFAGYLAGAAAFYDANYDEAHKQFAALSSSNLAWIKEAARYMLGRVELNRAQIHAFDQFENAPSPDKVDTASLMAARTAFQAYLHDYPQGDYAASARGLLRRVDWLGGDDTKLSEAYAQAITRAGSGAGNVTVPDLAQEVDNKLLGRVDLSAINDPILLATMDLVRMRAASSDDAKPASAFALAELEAQRPRFAGHAALFDYLLATHHFYVGKDPAAVLALLPSEAGDGSYLTFSRQVLRGLALEETKNPSAAQLWAQLYAGAHQPYQKGAAELALAMNYERGGSLDLVFAPGSPIRDVDIREILLRHAAGPRLLRDRARAPDAPEHERQVALYTLLFKDMVHGRYAAFLQDAALLPADAGRKPSDANAPTPGPDLGLFRWAGSGTDANDDDPYPCPSLHDVAGILSRAAHDPHGLMCLGEFIRRNALDGIELERRPPVDELGGAPSQFPGAGVARLDIYQQVIADPKAPANDRAYALYRAVNCYGPSGYNHCDGAGVAIGQRKQWFKMLKTGYAGSRWADALKYYW